MFDWLVNFAGGYSYDDERIKGFSLTHISGAGCSGYQDFPFIPTTMPITAAPTKAGSSDLDPTCWRPSTTTTRAPPRAATR